MHVLVTGATGTVGRFVVPALAAAGHRVTTLGRAGDLPWRLAGVHSARLDLSTRDKVEDESLGLNLAWYADVLMTLSESPAPAPGTAA